MAKMTRSEIMSRIRSKDTKPEMKLRRLAHSNGYRYRLHDRSLPGTPDMVFAGRGKIVFMHGCFWHQHTCSRSPKTNTSFWGPKLAANVERDRRHLSALRRMGWKVKVVWECELKDLGRVEMKLNKFLEGK